MQIFKCLFKESNAQGAQQKTTSKGQEDKPKDIISYKKRRSNSKSKKFKPIIFLCNKDIAKACFHSAIYLKKVHSSDTTHQHHPNSQSMMKKKKEGLVVKQKSDSSKVLPVSVSPPSSADSSNGKKDNKLKGDNKTKPMSRMKELLRWAAYSTKSEKGENLNQKVMKLKNRGSLKAGTSSDDNRLSSIESPKISFSTSISSSTSRSSMASSWSHDHQACNEISLDSTVIHGLKRCSSRGRNYWITTDAEFVVLELSG